MSVNPTSERAKGYGNNVINFVGEFFLDVHYCCGNVSHKFLVVNANHVSLLGRGLCKKLSIKFVFPNVEDNAVNTVSEELFLKYKDYIANDFKSSVKDRVHLELKYDVEPKFCKARAVPIRYRCKVKAELSRLESEGIISRVFQSKWSCPLLMF